MFHAAKAMNVNVENCILVDDSSAGARSGIAAGMEVFYFCADPHNPPIVHPKVTMFTDLAQLPALWKARGWKLPVKLPASLRSAGQGFTRSRYPGQRRAAGERWLLFRIFTRQQLIQLIAANVAEVLAFDEVEDIFADVLAAVADALNRAGAEQGGQHARNRT
ncbi:6-phosphogluconate phosphatase [Raoultella terrigena]|uniref:6-phosphogluconate phosphatase n=1 Tax=Raoultella terrigena TaxID=577 RepID=A0A7Z8ZFL1_RAOTE|nr:6-phosphogluconate phosphatase [Raoultella terrigena]